MVKSLGADDVIDYTKKDFFKSSKHYDIIFDAVCVNSYLGYKKVLADYGRFVSVNNGIAKGSIKNLLLFSRLLEDGEINQVIDRCYTWADNIEAKNMLNQDIRKEIL